MRFGYWRQNSRLVDVGVAVGNVCGKCRCVEGRCGSAHRRKCASVRCHRAWRVGSVTWRGHRTSVVLSRCCKPQSLLAVSRLASTRLRGRTRCDVQADLAADLDDLPSLRAEVEHLRAALARGT